MVSGWKTSHGGTWRQTVKLGKYRRKIIDIKNHSLVFFSMFFSSPVLIPSLNAQDFFGAQRVHRPKKSSSKEIIFTAYSGPVRDMCHRDLRSWKFSMAFLEALVGFLRAHFPRSGIPLLVPRSPWNYIRNLDTPFLYIIRFLEIRHCRLSSLCYFCSSIRDRAASCFISCSP